MSVQKTSQNVTVVWLNVFSVGVEMVTLFLTTTVLVPDVVLGLLARCCPLIKSKE